jgi:hypothetical protein
MHYDKVESNFDLIEEVYYSQQLEQHCKSTTDISTLEEVFYEKTAA